MCLKIVGGVANSVDPSKMLHYAATDHDLHCLPLLSIPILSVNMIFSQTRGPVSLNNSSH